jgi:preprotein translocase subunit SecB
MIAPIDFLALYRRQARTAAEAGAAPTTPPN